MTSSPTSAHFHHLHLKKRQEILRSGSGPSIQYLQRSRCQCKTSTISLHLARLNRHIQEHSSRCRRRICGGQGRDGLLTSLLSCSPLTSMQKFDIDDEVTSRCHGSTSNLPVASDEPPQPETSTTGRPDEPTETYTCAGPSNGRIPCAKGQKNSISFTNPSHPIPISPFQSTSNFDVIDMVSVPQQHLTSWPFMRSVQHSLDSSNRARSTQA